MSNKGQSHHDAPLQELITDEAMERQYDGLIRTGKNTDPLSKSPANSHVKLAFLSNTAHASVMCVVYEALVAGQPRQLAFQFQSF